MDTIERAWRQKFFAHAAASPFNHFNQIEFLHTKRSSKIKKSQVEANKSRRIEMESEDPLRFTGPFPRSSFANCLFAATAEARAANSSADIARVHRRRVHTGL